MPSMGSGAAEGLQDVLSRLFLEAQFKQQQKQQAEQMALQQSRLAEDARQANQRNVVDTGQLGLGREKFAEDTRQFEAMIPHRAANLRLTTAQAGEVERRPQAEQAAREAAGAKDERDFQQQQSLVRLQSSLRPADKERTVQIMGPEGTPIWATESQAIGKPAAQAARAVTGQERQTLAYFNRAKEADALAQKFEDPVAKAGIGSQLQQQYAPNMLQTSDQQAYRQAQRAFTEARLRKESGAAIPVGEYENDARTYFAQPGDSPQVREQKRQARQTVLEGLKFSSGKAFNEFYGDEGAPKPTPGGAPPLGVKIIREIKP